MGKCKYDARQPFWVVSKLNYCELYDKKFSFYRVDVGIDRL